MNKERIATTLLWFAVAVLAWLAVVQPELRIELIVVAGAVAVAALMNALQEVPQVTDEPMPGENEVAGERDRLEVILERMHDAVVAVDEDDRITLANDAAFKLLDCDDDDVDRPLIEAVPVPELLELVHRCQSGTEEAVDEFDLPGEPRRSVLAKAAPLRAPGGAVIVIHDITGMRRLERMRRDFVANVSHELRTPVSIISANAETLMGGALDDKEKAPAFVEAIARSSDRLTNLLADLLDLARIEAGQTSTRITTVSVAQAVGAIVGGMADICEKRNVTVHNDVAEDVAVKADAQGLTQILQNYIDNAIKYGGNDGAVHVRALPREDVVRIEVEDDGPGIAPKSRARVFERFYRVDKGRSREQGGTGLGLSIAKNLADQMNGSVGVDEAPRQGSVFWVELPLGEVSPRATR